MRHAAAALAVAAVLYFCFLSQLGAIGLVGPDEPRYAWVAREMYKTGDWITPRLYGEPWFEKPPLFYWAAAAAYSVFGVSEFSARLPSAVAALLAALALAWTAWRYYGAAAGFAVLLIFPTCIGVLGFARGASMDMVFSSMLALAMAAAAEVMVRPAREGRPAGRWQAFLGIFLGAAVLAKGPAGVVLAGGSVVVWSLVTGEWRTALRPLHPRVILWFAVTAVPWYVMCARINPGFAEEFLVAHNVQRYLTPVFRHVQPWWFFGPVLLLGLMPWAALLFGAARDGWRRGQGWRQSPSVFFACWALFPLLFFSFSQSKLPGYILPAVAPLVLIMVRSLSRSLEPRGQAAYWLLATVGATVVALALTAGHWLERLPEASGLADTRVVTLWLAAAAVAGAVTALLALLRKPWAALIFTALFLAGLTEATNRFLIPKLDPYLSARAAAQMVADDAALVQQLHAYKLHRAWYYGLNFYLGRELPLWQPDSDGIVWIFTSQTGRKELEARGRTLFVLPSPSPEALLVRIE